MPRARGSANEKKNKITASRPRQRYLRGKREKAAVVLFFFSSLPLPIPRYTDASFQSSLDATGLAVGLAHLRYATNVAIRPRSRCSRLGHCFFGRLPRWRHVERPLSPASTRGATVGARPSDRIAAFIRSVVKGSPVRRGPATVTGHNTPPARTCVKSPPITGRGDGAGVLPGSQEPASDRSPQALVERGWLHASFYSP